MEDLLFYARGMSIFNAMAYGQQPPTGVEFAFPNAGGGIPMSPAQAALEGVAGALRNAAAAQKIFSASQLECISGIETGRTWNPDIVAKNGRVGLFQFDEKNWEETGTSMERN